MENEAEPVSPRSVSSAERPLSNRCETKHCDAHIQFTQKASKTKPTVGFRTQGPSASLGMTQRAWMERERKLEFGPLYV